MHASLLVGSSVLRRSVSSPSDAAAPLRTGSIDQRINIIIWSGEIIVLSSIIFPPQFSLKQFINDIAKIVVS